MRMNLNLGCGADYRSDCVNVDIRANCGADVVWNLEKTPWPWDDESVDSIHAYDIIEHVEDFFKFTDEAWRVLRKDGKMMIRTNYVKYSQSFTDPSHKRFCTIETFDFLDPSTNFGKNYDWYTDKKFKILNKKEFGCDLLFFIQKISHD